MTNDLDDGDEDDGRDKEDGATERNPNFRNPPVEHRFKPGKSGNPRGRPKGALGLKAELKAELDEYVSVTVNGKQKRFRKRRLIIRALTVNAAKGDVKAADRLLALIIQAEGFEPEAPTKRRLSENDQQILAQFLGGSDATGTAASDAADVPDPGEPPPTDDPADDDDDPHE